MEKESFSSVEATLVFSLIWSLGVNFKAPFQKDFEAFLCSKIKQMVNLCTFYTRNLDEFGCGVVSLIESQKNKRNLFDFGFNHVKKKWELWQDMNYHIPENPVVDFTSCDLNIKELVHFNKDFLNIESFQNHIQNETAEIYLLPKNHIHIETISCKKVNYFMNYFLSYSKQVLLVSCQQNGKSNFVKDKIWNLLSKPEYSVLQIGLTKTTGIFEVLYLLINLSIFIISIIIFYYVFIYFFIKIVPTSI